MNSHDATPLDDLTLHFDEGILHKCTDAEQRTDRHLENLSSTGNIYEARSHMAKKKSKTADPSNSDGEGFDTRQQLPVPPQIHTLVRVWITIEEATDIFQQISRACIRNQQVLWSGMLRESAQKWADAHKLQTLTTALGPLLNTSHPDCPYKKKPGSGWSRYMHGASVIFAWYISQGDLVTVLSQPPPQRFHPSGGTYYQTIEEPIVKGLMGNECVKKMIVVHPTVGKAVEFKYELWPHDELSTWMDVFGIQDIVVCWRKTKGQSPEPAHTKKKTVPKAEAGSVSKSSPAKRSLDQIMKLREKRRRQRQRRQARRLEAKKATVLTTTCKAKEDKKSESVMDLGSATKQKGKKV